MDESQLSIALEACQFAISLFCFNILLLRQRNQRVYIPLAFFFGTNALMFLPFFLLNLDVIDAPIKIVWPMAICFAPLMFLQPFLFWLFVRGLTAEDDLGPVKYKLLHALPHFIVALLIAIFVVFSPTFFIAEITMISQLPVWVLYLAPFGLVMTGVYYMVVGTYLLLVVLLLRRYKSRVKDLFATTEGRELTWIAWIAVIAAFSIAWSALEIPDQAFGFGSEEQSHDIYSFVEAVLNLLIIWIIGIWGLRLKPGLSPAAAQKHHRAMQENADKQPKYERSALGEEQASRIARKIEAAMEQEKLYRDPGLSLWDLAQHVGVNSNHVSQTLNATLEKNFFDYVNGWRIKEAAALLQSTSKSILDVTYEVGFNSRSSFYTAFKRELGTTPKAYKNVQSEGGGAVSKVA